MKAKYIVGSIVMGLITIYSMQRLDKYNVAIPIIFGILTLISISLCISDKPVKKK